MLFPLIIVGFALAQGDPGFDLEAAPAHQHHIVPPYVPRSFSAGVIINVPAVSPFLLLDWNIDLYEGQRNTLYALVELGVGITAALPAHLTKLNQYSAIAGIGYRNAAHRLVWGFHVGIGVLWGNISHTLDVPFGDDNSVRGYALGRVQFGWQLHPNVVLGAFVAYASPWQYDTLLHPTSIYLGGWMPGIYLDWN